MSKEVKHDHRYTPEEEDYLRSRAQEHLIDTNHRVYPKDEDSEEPSGTPQSILNDLQGGEGVTGHVPKSTIGVVEVSGYDDAPEDVQNEIKSLTVQQLKDELEAIGVEPPAGASKDELRDLLAKEWSKT